MAKIDAFSFVITKGLRRRPGHSCRFPRALRGGRWRERRLRTNRASCRGRLSLDPRRRCGGGASTGGVRFCGRYREGCRHGLGVEIAPDGGALVGTWQGDALKYSMPGIYFARYLILMMGFFATYAGFLYNDFFGTGMNLFGSHWSLDYIGDDDSEYYKPDFDTRNAGHASPKFLISNFGSSVATGAQLSNQPSPSYTSTRTRNDDDYDAFRKACVWLI